MIAADQGDDSTSPPANVQGCNKAQQDQGRVQANPKKSASNLPRKQHLGQRRNDQKRHSHGCNQGEGFGESQRPEQFSFGACHGEYRQEADDGGGHRGQDGAADLAGGPVNDPRRGFAGLSLVEVFKYILDDDNSHIHHCPDGYGDTR